ncbi:hypothetical protein DOTSEDRAFT_75253 [Dothistroma septosporum NZE10]|uniref:C2H2-type domain-containing protein n=1 Tax=Dothistroma septosporum (strain NZE10 / CBS 128990) TaxID=675120 RepID=M2YKM6_DOTSN|nr:hypothetical protein DOTSEDRAFT_75253 [Dothistroma septosporum NZE10]
MLSHLEQGYCPGQIDAEDINRSTARCYQWAHYLYAAWRKDFLKCRATYSRNWNHPDAPWKCPTCGRDFKTLSALFRHAWSPACDEDEDSWPLRNLKRWLRKCHDT